MEGLPVSTIQNYGRKLILVPAGLAYSDWHDPSTLPRLTCFYFAPAVLPCPSVAGESISPRIFFEDTGLWNTAAKLKGLVDSPDPSDRTYCEALGAVLARELVRFVCNAVRARRRSAEPAGQQRLVRNTSAVIWQSGSFGTLASLAPSQYHFSRAF